MSASNSEEEDAAISKTSSATPAEMKPDGSLRSVISLNWSLGVWRVSVLSLHSKF